MWRDPLLRQRGAALPCHGSVLGSEILDGVGTQWATTRAGEQDLRTILSLFLNPRGEHAHGRFRQGGASLFPSFSLTSDMSTRTERDITLSKAGHLGKSQAGLHCGQQQSVVATSQPRVLE